MLASLVVALLAAPAACPARLARSVRAAATLPRGVVSVIDARFAPAGGASADPTGVADSTDAFQNAITASRTQNLTLWVPLGCYRITRTLNAKAPRNGRWQPVVIVGEIDRAAGGELGDDGPLRPTLWLPPSTPLFLDGLPMPLLSSGIVVPAWVLRPVHLLRLQGLGDLFVQIPRNVS